MAGRCRFDVLVVSTDLKERTLIDPLVWHQSSVLATGALAGKVISSGEEEEEGDNSSSSKKSRS